MKNDLISREALKKEIAKFHQEEKERLHNSLWESIGLNALNRIIDNAPTITSGLTDAEKVVCKAFIGGLDKTHSCNEYNILMGLIDNAPTVEGGPK